MLVMVFSDQNRYIYLFYGYESTLRYYWPYTCFTITGIPIGTDQVQIRTDTYTYFTDTRVPLGTTGLILVLPLREYP